METAGRFAPSPSGRIHLGNILCCLLAWLSARQKGGKIVLRIEDLDTARCPRRYAEQMEDEYTTVVALLHDIVEDTDMTLAELSELGFPTPVTEAIALLTHAPEVPYMDYVREIGKNPIAKAVKLADLRHNSDLTRMDVEDVDEWALKRTEKYKEAIRILTEEYQ